MIYIYINDKLIIYKANNLIIKTMLIQIDCLDIYKIQQLHNFQL